MHPHLIHYLKDNMIYIVYTILGISIFTNLILYFKVVKLENLLNESSVYYYNYLKNLLALFVSASKKMEAVDKNGSFSSDDEVGFVFKIIKGVIADLLGNLTSIKGQLDEQE